MIRFPHQYTMNDTIWYDTIRYDTIRYDTIRYDTIRYDTIRYDTIRYDTIRYDTIRYDTIRYDTIRYDTIRYDTIRYDTIRYDTIRYDTIRYGADTDKHRIQYPANPYPANTRRWPNAGLMLSHRLRRWANIRSALGQCLVFAGYNTGNLCSVSRSEKLCKFGHLLNRFEID